MHSIGQSIKSPECPCVRPTFLKLFFFHFSLPIFSVLFLYLSFILSHFPFPSLPFLFPFFLLFPLSLALFSSPFSFPFHFSFPFRFPFPLPFFPSVPFLSLSLFFPISLPFFIPFFLSFFPSPFFLSLSFPFSLPFPSLFLFLFSFFHLSVSTSLRLTFEALYLYNGARYAHGHNGPFIVKRWWPCCCTI